MRGRRVSTSSSWKEESSHTTHASAAAEPTRLVSGRPMFPATSAGTPAAANMAPSSAVVVVLPFVPVTPRIGFGSSRAPSSISEITSMPRARAAATGGASPGTPGLLTTSPTPSSSASCHGPRWTSASSTCDVCLDGCIVGDDLPAPGREVPARRRGRSGPGRGRALSCGHRCAPAPNSREEGVLRGRGACQERCATTIPVTISALPTAIGSVTRSPSTIAASAKPESGWRNWSVAMRWIPPRSRAQYHPA